MGRWVGVDICTMKGMTSVIQQELYEYEKNEKGKECNDVTASGHLWISPSTKKQIPRCEPGTEGS